MPCRSWITAIVASALTVPSCGGDSTDHATGGRSGGDAGGRAGGGAAGTAAGKGGSGGEAGRGVAGSGGGGGDSPASGGRGGGGGSIHTDAGATDAGAAADAATPLPPGAVIWWNGEDARELTVAAHGLMSLHASVATDRARSGTHALLLAMTDNRELVTSDNLWLVPKSGASYSGVDVSKFRRASVWVYLDGALPAGTPTFRPQFCVRLRSTSGQDTSGCGDGNERFVARAACIRDAGLVMGDGQWHQLTLPIAAEPGDVCGQQWDPTKVVGLKAEYINVDAMPAGTWKVYLDDFTLEP